MRSSEADPVVIVPELRMDISIYFKPSARFGAARPGWLPNSVGDSAILHTVNEAFPQLEGVQIAIFGVLDDPGHARPRTCVQAPDMIREQLYQLYLPAGSTQVVDLGDIHPGASAPTPSMPWPRRMAELIRMNIVPIMIGGGQGHTFSQYLAYEKLERTANLVCIDARFDLGEPGQGLADSQLPQPHRPAPAELPLQLQQPRLPDLLVDQPGIELMDKLFFDAHRLGELRTNMADAEPVMRNGDTLSVDMNAVRRSDAPGTSRPGPNGFHGEEICQLMRYAGCQREDHHGGDL
jgi:formiminoglutamase